MSKDRQARISEAAYRIWQREGFPEGRDIEHWLEAEREVFEAEQREAAETGPDENVAATEAAKQAVEKVAGTKPAAGAKAAKAPARKAGARKLETSGSSK